jgi:hypothetical protein
VRSNYIDYVSFKVDNRIVMTVSMRGAKGRYRLDFKVPEAVAMQSPMQGFDSLPCEHRFDQMPYLVSYSAVDLAAFEPLFVQAYEHVVAGA